jgi:hypothetical protein
MGLLSDFFIADETPAPDYQAGEAFDAADKCQFNDLSPLQAAQFLAVLRGRKYLVEMIREFKLVTAEDADDWTMTVPQDMVGALAALETPGIPNMASKFAEATHEELGWSPDEFVPIVLALSVLAQRAVAANKRMYLWNCV